MRIAGAAFLVLVLGVAVAAFVNEQTPSDQPSDPAAEATPVAQAVARPETSVQAQPVAEAPDQPPILRAAPSLANLDGWLQSDLASLEELRGSVVIVQFWTFGCHNCKATLPYLKDIYATYRERGLEIVGVHAPEFRYERDPDAIQAAALELGVTWPIALDTSRRDFRAWQGSPAYWPRTYVVDADGQIRFDHIGEGAYEELEQTVAALLAG